MWAARLKLEDLLFLEQWIPQTILECTLFVVLLEPEWVFHVLCKRQFDVSVWQVIPTVEAWRYCCIQLETCVLDDSRLNYCIYRCNEEH